MGVHTPFPSCGVVRDVLAGGCEWVRCGWVCRTGWRAEWSPLAHSPYATWPCTRSLEPHASLPLTEQRGRACAQIVLRPASLSSCHLRHPISFAVPETQGCSPALSDPGVPERTWSDLDSPERPEDPVPFLCV